MQDAPKFPEWTPDDLKAWRERMMLTQGQAAAVLGISRRAYGTREQPGAVISRETVLACLYLEEKAIHESEERAGNP